MDKLEFDNFEINASDQVDQKIIDDARLSEEEAIKFSSCVVAALERKAEEHNENSASKVNADELKKVYRRGAQTAGQEKGLCAMARVNMFLRMKKEGKIGYQEVKMIESVEIKELVFESRARIQVNSFVDLTESWSPTEIDLTQAAQDIGRYELNYDFQDINELYLDDYEKLDIIWG